MLPEDRQLIVEEFQVIVISVTDTPATQPMDDRSLVSLLLCMENFHIVFYEFVVRENDQYVKMLPRISSLIAHIN